MNSNQRAFWFSQVERKQRISATIDHEEIGEYCNWCGLEPYQLEKLGRDGLLCIDHIDNNNSNNVIENMQFLCKSCNRMKNPIKSVLVNHVAKTQSEITNEKEELWRDWVMEKVRGTGRVLIEDVIYAGAELFGVSPETIERRWYKKITSSAGLFIETVENTQDYLVFKSREIVKKAEIRKNLFPDWEKMQQEKYA